LLESLQTLPDKQRKRINYMMRMLKNCMIWS